MSYSENTKYNNVDIVSDIERILLGIEFYYKNFPNFFNLLGKDYLLDYAIKHLILGSPTDVSSLIVEDFYNLCTLRLDEEIENLAKCLAKEVKSPFYKLTTFEGFLLLLQSLNIKSHKTDKTLAKRLKSLPGSKFNNLLYNLYSFLIYKDLITSDKFRSGLNTKVAEAERLDTFENTRNKLQQVDVKLDQLCWAVLTFESHKHTNLVWHEANKLEKSFPSKESAELLSYGYMGLRTALRLFDPGLGFRFSTYAVSRINGTIRDGVRSESPIPKRLTTFQRKVNSVEADLLQALGRQPTLMEVAERAGEEIEKFTILNKLAPEASLDQITNFKESSASFIGEKIQNPEELIIEKFEQSFIDKCFNNLSLTEQIVVRRNIYEGAPLSKVAEELRLSIAEVKKLKQEALTYLREELKPIIAI